MTPELAETCYRWRLSITCYGAVKCVHLLMDLLMTYCAESDQILGSVIAQLASPLNVMDLKTFHPPARLATPAVSLQDLAAEFAIGFRIKS